MVRRNLCLIHHNKDLGITRFPLSYYRLLLQMKIWKSQLWFIPSSCVCTAQLIPVTKGRKVIYSGHCLIELAMAKFKPDQINQLNIQYSPFSCGTERTNTFSIWIFREISLLIDRQMICEIHWAQINGRPFDSSQEEIKCGDVKARESSLRSVWDDTSQHGDVHAVSSRLTELHRQPFGNVSLKR